MIRQIVRTPNATEPPTNGKVEAFGDTTARAT